jgi:hypothetical protein
MARFLPTLSFLGVAFASHFLMGAKIDEALPMTGDSFRPVFVRMEDQLFRKAGDYETFCKAKSDVPRSTNRKEVTALLRKKAGDSWEKVKGLLGELEKAGSIRSQKRFWIVNGFACAAKPEAIRRLTVHDAVSFVYLDRLAHPAKPPRAMLPVRMTAMKTLLKLREEKPASVSQKNARIPWNLKAIKAPEVWRQEAAFGQGVTVAVIDSGILPTPSLATALWKNPNETLNGEDDDDNGLVDDLFGYDFTSETGSILELGSTMSHGSSCAGIIAGRTSPKSGWRTGIAPQAELMLIKGSFDLRALEYLLLNGADVVSMSFMIVGRELGHLRGLYRNAFEHLSAAGVLSVGGAGNYGPKSRRAMPEGKQIGLPKDIPCVIAMAGVAKDRSPVAFSSHGPCYWDKVAFFSDYPKDKPLSKPDLTAFPTGYPMWTYPPNRLTKARGWKEISAEVGASLVVGPAGNSFSGPHGVGVVALVLSANPELNPWEVKELLEETATDLGDKGRDTHYGAGLIDALAAVRAARKID